MSIMDGQSHFFIQMTIDMTALMQNRIPNNFSSESWKTKKTENEHFFGPTTVALKKSFSVS